MAAINIFRRQEPKRSNVSKRSDYKNYKSDLAKDFHNRCGYTDCPDTFFGGQDNFHIDHFYPWKRAEKPEEAKLDYNNLVYCCSYVNILKSNKIGPFSDPCNVDFNKLFYRDNFGNICPCKNNESAKYMYYTMKMYMMRYGVIWQLEQAKIRILKLAKLIRQRENVSNSSSVLVDLIEMYYELEKYLYPSN